MNNIFSELTKVFLYSSVICFVGFSPLIFSKIKLFINNKRSKKEKLKPRLCFLNYKEEDQYIIYKTPSKLPKFEIQDRPDFTLNYDKITGIFKIFGENKWILTGKYKDEVNCNVIIKVNNYYYLAHIEENKEITIDGLKLKYYWDTPIIGKVVFETISK